MTDLDYAADQLFHYLFEVPNNDTDTDCDDEPLWMPWENEDLS